MTGHIKVPVESYSCAVRTLVLNEDHRCEKRYIHCKWRCLFCKKVSVGVIVIEEHAFK